MQQFAASRPRQLTHRVAHCFELHAVKRGEVVFILQQKIHIAFVHAIINRRFDVKYVQRLIDNLAKPNALVTQLGARGIHIAV